MLLKKIERMSEFDAFTSAEEKDPAADFLAREQDQLAALEDDEFGSLDKTEDVTQGDLRLLPQKHTSGNDQFHFPVVWQCQCYSQCSLTRA